MSPSGEWIRKNTTKYDNLRFVTLCYTFLLSAQDATDRPVTVPPPLLAGGGVVAPQYRGCPCSTAVLLRVGPLCILLRPGAGGTVVAPALVVVAPAVVVGIVCGS